MVVGKVMVGGVDHHHHFVDIVAIDIVALDGIGLVGLGEDAPAVVGVAGGDIGAGVVLDLFDPSAEGVVGEFGDEGGGTLLELGEAIVLVVLVLVAINHYNNQLTTNRTNCHEYYQVQRFSSRRTLHRWTLVLGGLRLPRRSLCSFLAMTHVKTVIGKVLLLGL